MLLIMTNYQHYDKETYFKKFSQSDVYRKIKKEYQYLFSDLEDIDTGSTIKIHRSEIEEKSIFLYSMFFYLEFLLENNPKVIADVGCGNNNLKKYIPQIVGIDHTIHADVQAWLDANFIKDNYEKFDAAFSINALHFVSLKDFASRINEFASIIKPGGRGFITFNLIRMLERTLPHEYAQLFDLSKPVTAKDYTNYIEAELKKIKYNILVKDILFENKFKTIEEKYNSLKGSDWPNFSKIIAADMANVSDHIVNEIKSFDFFNLCVLGYDDQYNGNIRIVFEK